MTAYNNIVCKKHDVITLIGGYLLCVRCGECKPGEPEGKIPLRPLHYIILADVREQFPLYFKKNRTAFMYSEFFRYIFEKKVMRITMMGETRGGKSEEAQTLALNYIIIWNALYDRGHFKTVDKEITDKIRLERLTFTVKNIHANASIYKYHLRDCSRDRNLLFGQISIIDEDRESEGGIGSFSEEMEEENLNNITAVFCQNEIWIKPKRFQLMNTPYGMNCLIKDESTRTNWSLLYKIEMDSALLREQNFLGWVGVKLHEDEELRHEYKMKKNTWVEQEFTGTINPRAVRRREAIEVLVEDKEFMQYSIGKNGQVRWKHSNEDMSYLVEQAMIDKRIDNFNETEIERIVHGVRTMGERRIREAENGARERTIEESDGITDRQDDRTDGPDRIETESTRNDAGTDGGDDTELDWLREELPLIIEESDSETVSDDETTTIPAQ